ncbi:MAG TPA: ferritin-like domain-containing protein [Rhizomicrobium sp.]|nr:ferritin-like domain-containing protein [Rhizomicrobium sp.]
MKIGSDQHKELFCRLFMQSHQPFEPEALPWPELDADALTRLRSVPFWQEVLHTEMRAGRIVNAFAPTIEDPALREAVALQGFEEARHAMLLRVMIERYGVEIEPKEPDPLPEDIETAFIDFGFGECLDSFLGFGAFKIARQSQFLPEQMFQIFETLMYEETRHIVFFINWMAWRETQKGRNAFVLRSANSLRYYGRALGRLAGVIRRGAEVNDGKDFSATQASVFLEGFTFRRFVEDCHAENLRRMESFDPQLLQPRFLPALAGAALSALRLRHPGQRKSTHAVAALEGGTRENR